MTGVSADPPAQPSQVELDVKSAYEGGGNFMARLQELSDAKARHDDALAALNLGKSAQEAFADATALHTAAAADRNEAKAALDQANQEAASILAKAQEDAAVMKGRLQEKIDGLHAAIDHAKAS